MAKDYKLCSSLVFDSINTRDCTRYIELVSPPTPSALRREDEHIDKREERLPFKIESRIIFLRYERECDVLVLCTGRTIVLGISQGTDGSKLHDMHRTGKIELAQLDIDSGPGKKQRLII